jgi:hypothetical protein
MTVAPGEPVGTLEPVAPAGLPVAVPGRPAYKERPAQQESEVTAAPVALAVTGTPALAVWAPTVRQVMREAQEEPVAPVDTPEQAAPTATAGPEVSAESAVRGRQGSPTLVPVQAPAGRVATPAVAGPAVPPDPGPGRPDRQD